MPRSTLGHYRILERIGAGGMGEVYCAEDLNLRRKVALKLLPKQLATNPEARQRLMREARSASQLGHPNIATVYDVGDDAGELYVAMELVEGESLGYRLRREQFPPDEIARIGAQVADALDAAHRQGVVHRDIKPSNIVIRPDGVVKVVDFGLAIHTPTAAGAEDATASPTEEMRLTRSGFAAGTVAYMSPEQAKGSPPSGATDVFSLGVVLYEMATSNLPFHGSTPLAVAAAIVHEPPTPPRELRADIPPGLEQVILKCLNKDTESRPDSAARVRDALLALLHERSTVSVMRALGSKATWLRPAIMAAVVLISLLAIVLWLLPPGDRRPPIEDVDARRLFEQGQQYAQRGYSPSNLRTSETIYRKALAHEPDNPVIQAWLASVLARLEQQYPEAGRRDEIRSLTDSALEASPDLTVAWAAKGRLLLLEGDTQGAERAGRRAIATAKNDPVGYIVAGQALIDRGEVDAGLEELRRGVALARGHITARSVLARRLLDLGRADEAVVEYNKILEYDPNHTSALSNLGAIYVQMGRLAESIDVYRQLLELQPDDVAAANLGTAYFFLGRMDEAIAAYQQAVELGPELPTHKVNLGEAYEEIGDLESARASYTMALSDYDRKLSHVAEGQKAEMLSRRGYCAARLGRFDEAEQNVETALGLAPDSHELQFDAARIYAMTGKRDAMYLHIGRAVEVGYPRGLFLEDPTFQDYRDEPRFLDLLTGAGQQP